MKSVVPATRTIVLRGGAAGVLALLLVVAARAQGESQAADALQSRADMLYEQGVAAEHKGAHDLAIADLTQSIALKRDFMEAYESRGVAYDQKGLYDRAIADYTEAIRLKPDAAETYFNRGAAYEHRRLYQKALADYRASLTLDPTLQPSKDGVARLTGAR